MVWTRDIFELADNSSNKVVETTIPKGRPSRPPRGDRKTNFSTSDASATTWHPLWISRRWLSTWADKERNLQTVLQSNLAAVLPCSNYCVWLGKFKQ